MSSPQGESSQFPPVSAVASKETDFLDIESAGAQGCALTTMGLARVINELSDRTRDLSQVINELSDRQLNPRVETARRMLESLDAYISPREFGISESLLYEHQRDVFHSIHDFLVDVCDDPNNAGLGHIKLPTGTGKTAIFATFIDVLSKHEPQETDDKSQKALVLVPMLDLVQQTKGSADDSVARGFAGFAPDLSVSEYHGTKKDLSGDVVVMTYYSFANAVDAGKIPESLFDLVVCDEAHKALGPRTSAAIEKYTTDKVAIGLTATPDYGENKKMADVFPYKIHDMGLREAVELGFLAPIQCLAVTSEQEIKTLNKYSKEFSDAELEPLIVHEWRNGKAVEITKAMVEQGKRGLISCVPGKDLAHAHLMSELLSAQRIVDPKTGQIRNIRAMAVGGHIRPNHRPEIYRQYEAGAIDVLCYVDLISEGWDSTAAKFLINLRPTASPVLAEQRIGRTLRPALDDEVAVIVEFIDQAERSQYTFYHAFGEEEINPRKVYGRGSGRGTGEPYDSVIFDNLPEDTRALLMQIQYKVIGELVVQKVPSAPEGYLSVGQFSRGINRAKLTIDDLIRENNVPVETHRYWGSISPSLSPEAQAQLLALSELQILNAPEGYRSIAQLVRQWKTSGQTLIGSIEDMGLPVEIHKYGRRPQAAPGISPETMAALLASPDFLLPIPRDYTSIPSLSKEFKISKATLDKLIVEHNIQTSRYRSHTHAADCLSPEAREQLLGLDEFQSRLVQEPPEGYISLRQFTLAQGTSIDRVRALVKKYGIETARYKHGSIAADSLSPEAQAELLAIPELNQIIDSAPPGYISLRRFAESIFSSPETVERILEAHSISLEVHKFGTNVTKSISPELQARLRLMPELQAADLPPEGYKSIIQIAKELEMQPPTILRAAETNGIPTSLHRYGKGVPARDVSPSDLVKLLALPELAIRRAPEGYLSISGLARALSMRDRDISRAVDEIGLETKTHRFRSMVGQGLSPEAQSQIRKHLGLE